jgi:hypothetical protein
VKVIAEYCRTQKVDGKVLCQLHQEIIEPLFSMVIVSSGDFIATEKEAPSHSTIHDMHGSNFICGKDLNSSQSGHGAPRDHGSESSNIHRDGTLACGVLPHVGNV